MKNNIPEIGDIIYLNSKLYLSHGADDLSGGKARVISVSRQGDSYWIMTEVSPTRSYNWSYLSEQQEWLKSEFGLKWANKDPDYRPEFNE